MDTQNETITAEPEANVDTTVQPEVVEAVQKVNARPVKTERKPRARKASAAATESRPRKARVAHTAPQIEEEDAMNFDTANWMNNFAAVPGADRFQTLFAEASERGQQMVERSQKAAGELVELTRANVEALVETGRIAAAGAQTLGQDALARTRDGVEQTVAQVKGLAEAQSPTEFFQLQGEIARTQFDRLVAEGSRFTESMVKLAGEAIQPLSNRAALNAEKMNDLTA